jgi:regulator of protease activity HflC (stomatin/prohibitin superfamily)
MKKQVPSIFIILGVAVLFIVLFSSSIFKTINPGERGVVFRPWTSGLDLENILTEGLQIIAPWNTLYIYNVKEQKIEETMDVLDRAGLSISVDSVNAIPSQDMIE